MTLATAAQFPAVRVALRDGRAAVIRPLRLTDGPALAALYAQVPRADLRFYRPHPLDAAHAARNAAAAESAHEVVLVLTEPDANPATPGSAATPPDALAATPGSAVTPGFAAPSGGPPGTTASAILGYAWYRWPNDQAEQSVFGICVARSAQGSGAGAALLARLCTVATTVGPAKMTLTVQKANARAFALYRKFGFGVVREQFNAPDPLNAFDAEPEYAMERECRVH